MWFHIRIYAQALAVTLMPYMLIGGLIRVFLPHAKVWRLCLLSVLMTLFVDSHLHFFWNPVDIDRIVADALSRGVPFQEFGAKAEASFVALTLAAGLFGSLLIPLGCARGGVAMVDKLRKWRRPNQAHIVHSRALRACKRMVRGDVRRGGS